MCYKLPNVFSNNLSSVNRNVLYSGVTLRLSFVIQKKNQNKINTLIRTNISSKIFTYLFISLVLSVRICYCFTFLIDGL